MDMAYLNYSITKVTKSSMLASLLYSEVVAISLQEILSRTTKVYCTFTIVHITTAILLLGVTCIPEIMRG